MAASAGYSSSTLQLIQIDACASKGERLSGLAVIATIVKADLKEDVELLTRLMFRCQEISTCFHGFAAAVS